MRMSRDSKRTQPQPRSLSIESLERRALLSVDLSNGILTIVGTKAADTIQLDASGTDVSVNVNGQVQLFNAADVQQFHISGGGGNDTITISDSLMIDAWVSGGKGDDDIHGGGGNDVLNGDQGNDVEDGDAGNDEIHGGVGNDSMQGGEGDDELDGENGNDQLDGDEGNDHLDGGAGNDQCNGGLDDDVIYGGTGNDHLNGEQGDDQL